MITPITFKYRLHERSRKREAAVLSQKQVDEAGRYGYQILSGDYLKSCEQIFQMLKGGKQ